MAQPLNVPLSHWFPTPPLLWLYVCRLWFGLESTLSINVDDSHALYFHLTYMRTRRKMPPEKPSTWKIPSLKKKKKIDRKTWEWLWFGRKEQLMKHFFVGQQAWKDLLTTSLYVAKTKMYKFHYDRSCLMRDTHWCLVINSNSYEFLKNFLFFKNVIY